MSQLDTQRKVNSITEMNYYTVEDKIELNVEQHEYHVIIKNAFDFLGVKITSTDHKDPIKSNPLAAVNIQKPSGIIKYIGEDKPECHGLFTKYASGEITVTCRERETGWDMIINSKRSAPGEHQKRYTARKHKQICDLITDFEKHRPIIAEEISIEKKKEIFITNFNLEQNHNELDQLVLKAFNKLKIKLRPKKESENNEFINYRSKFPMSLLLNNWPGEIDILCEKISTEYTIKIKTIWTAASTTQVENALRKHDQLSNLIKDYDKYHPKFIKESKQDNNEKVFMAIIAVIIILFFLGKIIMETGSDNESDIDWDKEKKAKEWLSDPINRKSYNDYMRKERGYGD